MTALEELRALYHQFPRATELAVSRDVIQRFLIEHYIDGPGKYEITRRVPGRLTFYGKPLTYWPEDRPVIF